MRVLLVKPLSNKRQSQTSSNSQSLQNRLTEQLEAIAGLVEEQLKSAGIEDSTSLYYASKNDEESTRPPLLVFTRETNVSSQDIAGRTNMEESHVLSTADVKDQLHSSEFIILFTENENECALQDHMANLIPVDTKTRFLTAYPCYPYSLLQNEIGYSFDLNRSDRSISLEKKKIINRELQAKPVEPTPPLSSHYLQFEPVSNDLIYQNQAHATGVVIAPRSVIAATTTDLVRYLDTTKQIAALTLLTNHPDTVTEIPDRIKIKLINTNSIDYASVLSMLSKSSLVLTMGNGLHADACRLNIRHLNYDNPAESVTGGYISAHPVQPPSVQTPSEQTTDQLDKQISLGISEGYILPNHPESMSVLLNQLIDTNIRLDSSISTAAATIIPWPTKPPSSERMTGFINSWSSGKRKLTKFRESPKRFFRDSQHPLIGYFK